ncbi:MAG: hypothetical protein M0P70_07505 [Desulfobulbaceae bacterium]|nr:hypothetical protein [Desulfobulbaceae bacterium]
MTEQKEDTLRSSTQLKMPAQDKKQRTPEPVSEPVDKPAETIELDPWPGEPLPKILCLSATLMQCCNSPKSSTGE